MRTITLPGNRRIFFGWWVVFGALMSNLLASGFYYFGFSAFFLPLQDEFHVGRAAISGAVSLASVTGLVLWPLQGMAIDRFGPVWVSLVGVVLTGVGFIVMGQVHSLFAFYVVYMLLISTGIIIGFAVTGQAAVANWFVRKRAFALGIVLSGIGLGTGLVWLVAWLIGRFGWHEASVISGLIIIAVGVPISLLLLHRPEPYGLHPDGAAEGDVAAANQRDGEVQLSTSEALRTKEFWLTAFVYGLRNMVGGALGLHFIPLMVGKGFSMETAAAFMTVWGLVSVPGRLGFGWLGDKWNLRDMSAAASVLIGVSMLVLLKANSAWQVVVFMLIYGTAFGGHVSLMPALWGEYFGTKAYATISGWASLVGTAFSLAGPVLAGFIYDRTKSYDISLMVFAGACVFITVLMLLARRPVSRRAAAH